ncbi:MAG: preprotein translocase subunit SecY [Anaerolineae bacterium]
MLESMTNAFRLPDLRRRLLYTLWILVVFRLAAHVPVPGLNRDALAAIFQSDTAAGQIIQWYNLLAGGAVENFSVVAMGVYPYITASIIMQLLQPIFPALEELAKEGEAGRNKLNLYTYWLTVPLALVQAIAQVTLINSSGQSQVLEFGAGYPLNTITVLMALTAGTMFALWLGERITEEGIGNGVSIIIFGGIVSGIPAGIFGLLDFPIALIVVVVLTIITILAIVVIQEGHRRIPVQYGKRVRGTKVYGGQSTYIPLRVNSAGMIPLIFASSLLLFPGLIGGFLAGASGLPQWLQDFGFTLQEAFSYQSTTYFVFYFLLVVAFTYFYTDVVFRQQNLPDTLQRNGGFIPGIRPGKRTEEYLNTVMHRITAAGALFLGIVAIMPWFAAALTNLPPGQSLIIRSTGLLIVVGVVLDTIKQLEAQLLMRHYEGFIR